MLFDLIASFIKAVLAFAVVMSFVLLLIWLERKLVAWMQQRWPQPHRAVRFSRSPTR